MKAPTKTEAAALQQATDKAASEANSERFYKAKHELFFCTEVVKLAAYASAMRRSLEMLENSGKVYPAEWERITSFTDGVKDYSEMQTDSLHWSLDLAAQRIDDIANTMESAFMAAERGHHAQ